MKTLTICLIAVALGAGAISYAQYANTPAPAPSVPATCTHMLVPRFGAANDTKRPPVVLVTCTPELMATDWRCQQACLIK